MKIFVMLSMTMLCFALAQQPSFSEFLVGEADINEATLLVTIHNTSPCFIDTVTIRAMHNELYKSFDTLTLNTALAPGERSLFAANASQVFSDDWMWTIDAITVSGADCTYDSEVVFDRADFGEPLINLAPTTTTEPVETAEAAEPALENAPPELIAAIENTDQQLATALNTTTYTVKTGDTLWKISQQFNTTVDAIMVANARDTSALIVGEVIDIPQAGAVDSESNNSSDPSFISYTVQAGDSLWLLASQYRTTVDQLERANCFSSGSVLSVGDEIRIPQGELVAVSCP